LKGKIASWFNYRGFGFIKVEGQENDVIVHTSDLKRFFSPEVGDTVEFEFSDSYKARARYARAVNVEMVSHS
jgi:cold shock CspA family protein